APQPDGMLAWKLPWLSEPTLAIALAHFRSLTRAPEARMLLLSPVFMVVIFGGLMWRGNLDPADHLRTLMACGAIAMILLTLAPQFVSMYLVLALLANFLSIVAPMPIAAGSFKPVRARVLPTLLHMVAAMLFPLLLAPTLLPLGVEFALETLEWSPRLPIC